MERNKVAILGAKAGIMSQFCTIIVKFIVRTYTIHFLGKEILGLDSVLIDTINMLSLAEMGVTSAMLFRLYTPIVKQDKNRVGEWMATYRKIYRFIAVIISFLGIIISFFLSHIIKDVSISWSIIYIAYYIQLLNIVCSYLLAYERILLNAVQKKYVCLIVDAVGVVVFSIFKVISIVVFSSYLLYLVISVIQTVSCNTWLYIYSKKRYAFAINGMKSKAEDLKIIVCDAKEVLANKISSFVYSSTDNLIISAFMGTGIVGVFSNYKYVMSALRSMINSAMITMQPLIGNYLNSNITKENSYKTLKRYTFIRFLIAAGTAIPFIVVVDSFVLLWTGKEQYLMSSEISILLAIDYYVGCIYGSLGEYLTGMGKFKQIKYATFLGTITNIVFSLIGVILFGVRGVLVATVISQIVIWVIEAYFLLWGYYHDYVLAKKDYLIMQIKFFTVIFLCVVLVLNVKNVTNIDNLYFRILFYGLMSELILSIEVILVWYHTDEFYFLLQMIKNVLK